MKQEAGEAKIASVLLDHAGWRRVRESAGVIRFEGTGKCSDTEPDRLRELGFWVTGTGCGGPSCVLFRHFAEVNPVTGHTEYGAMDVYVNHLDLAQDFCPPADMVFCAYHTINHEIGHVLGLDDSPPCPPEQSIMHNNGHGCTYNWPFPDEGTDILSVELMVPVGGGSGPPYAKGVF